MISDNNIEFEALFTRIRSPQTAKRFKLLSSATTQDLARTFQPEKGRITEQQERLGFHS